MTIPSPEVESLPNKLVVVGSHVGLFVSSPLTPLQLSSQTVIGDCSTPIIEAHRSPRYLRWDKGFHGECGVKNAPPLLLGKRSKHLKPKWKNLQLHLLSKFSHPLSRPCNESQLNNASLQSMNEPLGLRGEGLFNRRKKEVTIEGLERAICVLHAFASYDTNHVMNIGLSILEGDNVGNHSKWFSDKLPRFLQSDAREREQWRSEVEELIGAPNAIFCSAGECYSKINRLFSHPLTGSHALPSSSGHGCCFECSFSLSRNALFLSFAGCPRESTLQSRLNDIMTHYGKPTPTRPTLPEDRQFIIISESADESDNFPLTIHFKMGGNKERQHYTLLTLINSDENNEFEVYSRRGPKWLLCKPGRKEVNFDPQTCKMKAWRNRVSVYKRVDGPSQLSTALPPRTRQTQSIQTQSIQTQSIQTQSIQTQSIQTQSIQTQSIQTENSTITDSAFQDGPKTLPQLFPTAETQTIPRIKKVGPPPPPKPTKKVPIASLKSLPPFPSATTSGSHTVDANHIQGVTLSPPSVQQSSLDLAPIREHSRKPSLPARLFQPLAEESHDRNVSTIIPGVYIHPNNPRDNHRALSSTHSFSTFGPR